MTTAAGKAYIVKTCPLRYCRLHVKYAPMIWRMAREKAEKLDYRKGEPIGLYPFKWEAEEARGQGFKINYYYDYDRMNPPGRLGFFAYTDPNGPDLVPRVIHVGIFPYGLIGTTAGIEENEYFLLHRVFRAELLDIKMKYVIENPEEKDVLNRKA